MLYRYQPLNPREVIPVLGIFGPGVYDLSVEDAARFGALVSGVGGGPSLVPEYVVPDSVSQAVADFMAAVSLPTDANPETTPQVVSSRPKRSRSRSEA